MNSFCKTLLATALLAGNALAMGDLKAKCKRIEGANGKGVGKFEFSQNYGVSEYGATTLEFKVHHLSNGSIYDVDVYETNPMAGSATLFQNFGTWTPVKGKKIEASGLTEDVDLNDMDGYYFAVVNTSNADSIDGCCKIMVDESSESSDSSSSSEDEGADGGNLPFIP